MADEKDMNTEMPQDDALSLDEMLDQIIDEDVEGVDESQMPEPEVNLDDLIDEPVEDQSDIESEEADSDDAALVPNNLKDIDLDSLTDEQVGALMTGDTEEKPEDAAAKQKRRQLLWMIFGIACILAIILPAAWVFLRARSIASNTPQKQQTIVPVKSNPATQQSAEMTSSAEATKTAATVSEEKESTKPKYREVDLEEWNYYVHGFNIFAPARGERVKDGSGAVNANYKATVYDALDILVNKANGIQITIPMFSDETATDNNSNTSSDAAASSTNDTVKTSTNSSSSSSSKTTSTRIVLDAIGSSSTEKIAIWAANGKSYQTEVGDKIGSTGWKVLQITSSTATIKNGSKLFTLRVGGSAK